MRTVISSQRLPTLGTPLVQPKHLLHCSKCVTWPWTVIYVGEELLQRKVILLPVVHDSGCFHEILTEGDLQGIEKTSVTSLWVLSNLTSDMQQHLVFSYKTCKYGTVLYRPNTDLHPILQQALWKLHQYELQPNKVQPDQPQNPPSNALAMDKVLDDLNVKVQDQYRSFLAKDAEFITDYNKTDIDKLIDQINPEIRKAICMLTRSVSERRGTSKSLTNPASSTNHIKKVRRLSN